MCLPYCADMPVAVLDILDFLNACISVCLRVCMLVPCACVPMYAYVCLCASVCLICLGVPNVPCLFRCANQGADTDTSGTNEQSIGHIRHIGYALCACLVQARVTQQTHQAGQHRTHQAHRAYNASTIMIDTKVSPVDTKMTRKERFLWPSYRFVTDIFHKKTLRI